MLENPACPRDRSFENIVSHFSAVKSIYAFDKTLISHFKEESSKHDVGAGGCHEDTSIQCHVSRTPYSVNFPPVVMHCHVIACPVCLSAENTGGCWIRVR